MFRDESVVVEDVKFGSLFPPPAFLGHRKWYEIVSAKIFINLIAAKKWPINGKLLFDSILKSL